MPIRGMTDRQLAFPEIGAVRKGEPKGDHKPGRDLDYFRVEIDEGEPETAALFKTIYGDKPRVLNVLLPFNGIWNNLAAWREAYVAGALLHRCDGEVVIYEIDPATGERLVVDGVPHTPCTRPIFSTVNVGGKPVPQTCKPVARLKVILPELKRLAFFVVHTTSVHDIINLSNELRAIEKANDGVLQNVPLVLRRVRRMVSTPNEGNKRARREKWLLSIEAAPDWVARKIDQMRIGALPEIPQLAAVPPARLAQLMDQADPDDDAEYDTAEPTPAAAPASRPYPAEVLRAKVQARADEHRLAGKPIAGNGPQVDGALMACFAGEADVMGRIETVRRYLTGAEGTLTAFQCRALLDWLKPAADSGGMLEVDRLVRQEASEVYLAATMEPSGQSKFGL